MTTFAELTQDLERLEVTVMKVKRDRDALLIALTELMAAFGGVQTHAQQAKWDKAKEAIRQAEGE